jgi:hypothetical protein
VPLSVHAKCRSGAGRTGILGVITEMFRHVDWPFPDGEFPPQLGAVVQRTVNSGEWPALLVIHDADNDWLIGDGVNDPDGASVAAHVLHGIERDPSVATLADLPPGWQARRDGAGKPWIREPHTYG